MVLRSEQETMQIMIREAIMLLCKKHLKCKKSINLEALVGITLDDDDIILVSVKESLKPSAPKKSPMQVALKSVQTAVQRVHAKSAVKKSLEEQTLSQPPSIINIVPTNLPDTQETPVAIGTIETDSVPDSEISFEFLNQKVEDEDLVIKEEKYDDEDYSVSAEGYLVPGPIVQADELFQRQSDDQPMPSASRRKRGRPRLPEEMRKSEYKVRKPAPKDDSQKMPRMYVPDGSPAVSLDVRYLGLDRIISEDREYKRGRLLEKLTEGTTKWNELNQHQRNCVFAKIALRGKEENEIVCSLCYQLFTKAQEYKNHIKSHFDFGQFNCNVCDEQCYGLAELESHMASHRAFPCPLCNESYPSKSVLTTHIRSDHRIFFQEPTTNESPEAKEVLEDDQPKSNREQPSTSDAISDQKPSKPPLKDSKEDVSTSPVVGKANTMQVKVVPQLSRTGSGDSDQEPNAAPKVQAPIVTRSRGTPSKTIMSPQK